METNFSILIIEDDVLLNDMTKRLLTQHGYCVTSAYSGSEALLLIEKSSFDLILLDLMLPGIPGEIVLDKIKAMMDIPIIGVSAKTDIDSKVNLIRTGLMITSQSHLIIKNCWFGWKRCCGDFGSPPGLTIAKHFILRI